jgi:hypothetical protein
VDLIFRAINFKFQKKGGKPVGNNCLRDKMKNALEHIFGEDEPGDFDRDMKSFAQAQKGQLGPSKRYVGGKMVPRETVKD